jgi:hypothetical protein
MTRHRVARAAVILSVACGLVTLGMPQASAHVHPTPKDLTGPGVVYIESGYHVEIALIEHGIRTSHINLIKRSYDPVLLTGSGFAVDPSAVIVTTGIMAAPDAQAAKNYAVNQIFQATYGDFRPPADPFAQNRIDPTVGASPDDYTEANRLKGCYLERTNTAGGCVITITKKITVYPYVTNQDTYGRLDATVLTPGSTGDIALLRVSAGSMPTVNLADSTAGVYHLGVLGFNGIPGKAHPVLAYKAHLDKVGGSRFKPAIDDNKVFGLITPQVLASGLQGGPVAAELGQVIGFISAPPQTSTLSGTTASPILIRNDAVLAALTKQHVTPIRGPGDGNFESAMHKFQNKGYAASIPGFQNALAVYPGHFLAAQNLAVAKDMVGKGQGGPAVPAAAVTVTAASHHSSAAQWWTWLAIGFALIILAAIGAALLIRRRRAAPPPAGATASSSPDAPKRAGTATAAPRPAGSAFAAGARPAAASNRASTPEKQLPSRAGRPPGSGAVRTEANPRGDSSLMSRAASTTGSAAPKAPTFCTNCGGRLAPHHQYCGWCGGPVS